MRSALYVLLGVLLVPTVGLVGDIVTDGKFTSTLSSGAPLQVASDDMVANLNADMVDGVEGTDIYTKAEVNALVAAAAAADSRRWYYLTGGTYRGGEPLTACASGFHMASIYEILDVSNLRYDAGRGLTAPDSGKGPPQGCRGWVRTGESYEDLAPAGESNCVVWTSSSHDGVGTAVYLDPPWEDSANRYAPWRAEARICDEPQYVWCVED